MMTLFLLQMNDSLMSPNFDSAIGIYSSIAWFATIFGAAFFLLALLGAGFADVGADSGHGAGGYFSLHAMIGFLLGFGWGGFILMEQGAGVFYSSLGGFAIGAVMFVIVLLLMRCLTRLQVDGNTEPHSLEGLTGTVYVTIPPAGESGGQVQISHPNGLLTLAATQDGPEPLKLHSKVQVITASAQGVLVKAL